MDNEKMDGDSKKRKRGPADPQERRTLMLGNLPRDTTLRELQNMFHFWPGFLKAQLYDKKRDADPDTDDGGGYVSAFILFDNPHNAVVAKDRLQNYIFDNDRRITLRVNIAMKNLVLSRQELDDISGRHTHAPPPPPPPPDYYGMREWSPYAPPPPPPPYHPYMPPVPRSRSPPVERRSSTRRPSSSNGPPSHGPPSHSPINTIFVSSMDGISDNDFLSMLQSSCSGFKNHKMTSDRQGQRVAFVEFDSVSHAEEAIPILQGQNLQASFAKNPLNRRAR